MSPDPWTSFLDWLTTVLVPSWGELIGLLPYVVIGTIVGPFLTLIVLSRREGFPDSEDLCFYPHHG